MPLRRKPREVGEQAAAGDETLDPVVEQVAAGAFDQVHEGQLLLERDLLRATQAIAAALRHRAGLDAAVVDDDDAAHAADEADAGEDGGAGDGFGLVRRVDQIAGDIADLQPGHARDRAGGPGVRAAAAGRVPRTAPCAWPTAPARAH